MKFRIVFFFSLFLIQNLTAEVIFVNRFSTGNNNGISWEHAFTDLNSALNSADEGDTVWIATGEYFPTADNDRYKHFTLNSGIALFGGFAGTETDISQRNIELNPTVLSGNIGNTEVQTDNSLTVLYVFQPNIMTSIDGVTITQGYADSTVNSDPYNAPPRNGGGIFVDGNGDEIFCTLKNCMIVDNYCSRSGGGLYINHGNGGEVAAENCLFGNNTAANGACITAYGQLGKLILENSNFEENTAGLTEVHADEIIEYIASNTTFTFEMNNCEVRQNRGCRIELRGTSALNDTDERVKISNCVFKENENLKFSFWENTLYPENAAGNLSVANCKFSGNISDNPLSIMFDVKGLDSLQIVASDFNDNSYRILSVSEQTNTFDFIDCNFTRNNYGQFLFKLLGAVSNIKRCTFKDNRGGVLFDLFNGELDNTNRIIDIENSLFSYNDNLISGGNKIINHCTFVNNTPAYADLIEPFEIKNSIFYYDDESIQYPKTEDETQGRISNSLFYKKTCADIYDENVPNPCGENNLFAVNPLFRDLENDDYRLSPCSPAIDAGVETGILTDLLGNGRSLGTAPDAGAYETPTLALTVRDVKNTDCTKANGSVSFATENACAPYSVFYTENGNTFSDTKGLAAGDYVFHVEDAGGQKDTVFVRIDTNTEQGNYFMLPNLVLIGQEVTIRSCIASSYKFELFDNIGRSVRRGDSDAASFIFEAPQQAGVYNLQITDADKNRYVRRLIVQ